MRATSSTISEKDMAHSNGKTVESTKASGRMVSSMEKEHLSSKMARIRPATGRMGAM